MGLKCGLILFFFNMWILIGILFVEQMYIEYYQYIKPCTQYRRHSGKQPDKIPPFVELNKPKAKTDK